MKKIAILFIITTLFCCSTDESSLSNSINGSWHLTGYLAFMETMPVLNNNDVVYNFDTESKKVVIHNNVETIYPYIKKAGTYSMSGDNTTIFIDGHKYSYIIVDEELKISDNSGSGDGPILTFAR